MPTTSSFRFLRILAHVDGSWPAGVMKRNASRSVLTIGSKGPRNASGKCERRLRIIDNRKYGRRRQNEFAFIVFRKSDAGPLRLGFVRRMCARSGTPCSKARRVIAWLSVGQWSVRLRSRFLLNSFWRQLLTHYKARTEALYERIEKSPNGVHASKTGARLWHSPLGHGLVVNRGNRSKGELCACERQHLSLSDKHQTRS